MALPPLLKHIYNHGSDEVIRRGKRIFLTGGVQMLDVDHLQGIAKFRVRNDQYYNHYNVTINHFAEPKLLSVRCQCPYNLGEICRHEAAALFHLNELVQSGRFNNEEVVYNQSHTILRLRDVNETLISSFASPEIVDRAREWAAEKRATVTEVKDDRVSATVQDEAGDQQVLIRQNEERYFDTSCGCNETQYAMCVHKATVFLQLLQERGAQFFRTLHNWDAQKNKLLALYGYTIKDDLAGKFEFTYKDGKPFMRVLDNSIKKVSAEQRLATATPMPQPVVTATAVAPEKPQEQHLGIVLDTTPTWYPFVQVQLIEGIAKEGGNKFTSSIERVALQQYVNTSAYPEDERDLIPTVRKFFPEEILKYLKKNLPFGDFFDDYQSVLTDIPQPEVTDQVWEYLLPKYQRLLEHNTTYPLTFLHRRGTLSSTTIEPIGFGEKPVQPAVYISLHKKEYRITLEWNAGGQVFPHKEATMLNPGLLLYAETVYALPSTAAIQLVSRLMPDGILKVTAANWPAFLIDEVMKWRDVLPLHFAPELMTELTAVSPEPRLYLQERESLLILQPAFDYDGAEINYGYKGNIQRATAGKIVSMQRDEAAEQKLIDLLQHLHSDMKESRRDHFFYLPAAAVLDGAWFFHFMDKMGEHQVPVLGMERLKQLRVNTNRPETKVRVSSGIDWLDAQVDLIFGDQHVSITEVKRALQAKQHYVALNDGTLGMLPDEWLKKYSLLLKMGDAKGGKLRLKKTHFSVLDELLAEINQDEVAHELEERKERLADIIDKDFSLIDPPTQLQATLRPYQKAGFQWLDFLHQAGWGGILADDMGLGKTVQTLAYFQQYNNENPDSIYMVVCPTTLVYNWEAEIKKFTPTLTYLIHHGPKRANKLRDFEGFNVIITTYGTMRSDVKLLKDCPFDYIVLDESQAIKNPQSQVAKASLLLQSKNRLALSGTPVQNNTFDLYAQMNFLNPGLLGSREFFMNEFATPIDKFGEDEVKQQLRKLIYPFMLRRTKEQVAKDLPSKTETVLYCEMGTEQRKVYDAYRNDYRAELLGLIDSKGIERAQFHILQGLTKLRQICDSPAILNEQEKFANHSIKEEELMRELTENIGDHKALVFSQFLGMLGLIRKQLEAQGIGYAYFDGSSTTTERQAAIQKFQNEDDCRVFLISLKAGGIGLNLTAADYVYIVDPWWNPAVEQQAIDRTHRIGQTKSIFAYRLICRNTIEEKMLELQERKRALATELVADDSAILKRLSREDIAYLLS